MHDIDRTVREFETAQGLESNFENPYETSYENPYESAFENAYESNYENVFENNFENSYENTFENAFENAYESSYESAYERPVFSETTEMELATELLESLQSEQQMEEFFGKLLKKAASAAGKFIKSPIGNQLVGALKGVAKTALPVAGAALGNLVAPGIGGAIGGKLGSMATKLFEMELEGMSGEDREFAVARRVVRLAGTAAKNAANISPNAPPVAGARAALALAARHQAPGLLPMIPGANRIIQQEAVRRGRSGGSTGRSRSGRRSTGSQANMFNNNYNYAAQQQSEPYYDDDNGEQTTGTPGIRRRAGRWYRRGGNIVVVL